MAPRFASPAGRVHTGDVADDLVLEHLKAIRRDMATKDDLAVATGTLATRAELEALKADLTRHFVEVQTRITTEVHELIALLRELIASRDRLATRVSQLEQDVETLKRRAG